MLDIKKLAVAFGVTWGVYVLFIGWVAWLFNGWGDQIVDVLNSLYVGYHATFVGGIVGGVWGFVDGAIGGAIAAWIYNSFKGSKE